jgi:hypothetical protein
MRAAFKTKDQKIQAKTCDVRNRAELALVAEAPVQGVLNAAKDFFVFA